MFSVCSSTKHPLVPLRLNICFPLLPAASSVPQRAVFMPSVTVKEGYLHKHKAEGPQLLSRFAFKKRYFWLTSETLSYAKTSDWQVGTEVLCYMKYSIYINHLLFILETRPVWCVSFYRFIRKLLLICHRMKY